jgi:hypothetical protein
MQAHFVGDRRSAAGAEQQHRDHTRRRADEGHEYLVEQVGDDVTVTLIGDGQLGLPMETIYPDEIRQARDRGLGVIFITHNPHHAWPVGDRFVVLNRGRMMGAWDKGAISRDELVRMMAGGAELEQLTHELERRSEVAKDGS